MFMGDRVNSREGKGISSIAFILAKNKVRSEWSCAQLHCACWTSELFSERETVHIQKIPIISIFSVRSRRFWRNGRQLLHHWDHQSESSWTGRDARWCDENWEGDWLVILFQNLTEKRCIDVGDRVKHIRDSIVTLDEFHVEIRMS